MSDEIIKILDDLARRLGIVIDWSSKNIMPYLQDLMSRFIDYEVATSIAYIIIGIICCIGGIILLRKCNEFGLIWIILIIIGIFIIGIQTFDIIECYTIPEKVIYEYINYALI